MNRMRTRSYSTNVDNFFPFGTYFAGTKRQLMNPSTLQQHSGYHKMSKIAIIRYCDLIIVTILFCGASGDSCVDLHTVGCTGGQTD